MADFTEEIIIDTTVQNADKSEKQLDDLAKATNKADSAGEEYTETLGGMSKEVEIFGVSINGMVGAFKNSVGAIANSVKGLKAWKVALASTGIGLLVVALGSLVAWLQKSQEGMNFLNDAIAVVKATIDTLIGSFAKLGGAIVKVFKGDFKGALNDAKGAFAGFTDQIKQAVKDTLSLEKAVRALQIALGQANVLTAANNQEIAKNKQTIEDVNASTRTRIQLAQRNLELIKLNGDLSEENALEALNQERDRIKQYNETNGLTETLIEDQRVLRQLEADLIAVGTERFEREIEFKNKLNELNAQFAEEEHERRMLALTDMETEKAFEIQAVSDTVDINQRGLDAMNASLKNYYKAKDEKRKIDLGLADEQARLELGLVADLYGAIAGIAGQDSELGKALAIAQASINTYLGITAVLSRPIPLAQKILEIGIVTATGFKAVQDITSTPLPKVTIAESPFGDGGLINGSSHGGGGVWLNAEGGEAIINKRSMAIPWIRKQASYLNTLGGGVPFMERGGVVPQSTPNPFANLERAMAQSQTVLILDDLDRAQNNEFVTRVATTL